MDVICDLDLLSLGEVAGGPFVECNRHFLANCRLALEVEDLAVDQQFLSVRRRDRGEHLLGVGVQELGREFEDPLECLKKKIMQVHFTS